MVIHLTKFIDVLKKTLEPQKKKRAKDAHSHSSEEVQWLIIYEKKCQSHYLSEKMKYYFPLEE